MTIANLGLGKADSFLKTAINPPKKDSVTAAVNLLLKINALKPGFGSLEAPEELTALGRLLAELPIGPMLGKMVVIGALFSCLDPILSIACVFSEKDIFVITGQRRGELTRVRLKFAGDCKSDHIMISRVVKEWEAVNAQVSIL
jgi:ATP-dependent RNA helicase DHX36